MRNYVPVILGIAATACGGSDAGPTSPTTGSLEINTQTSGELPSGSYRYRVDGEPAQDIGTNATVSRPDLEPGSHVVQLTALPDGCTAGGDNPQAVSVEAGATTSVDFAVTCVPPVGTIQVETATSGPAPAGYDLVIDADPQGSIGASETRALDGIPSGVHSVGISAVPANCELAGENPRTMTLQTGATAAVSFAVTCTPPPPETGTLRVTIATTGVDPDGYRLVVDDGARQPIGVNGAVILANVAVGNHMVRLADLATGCTPAEANPRQVSVASGATASVAFTITCVPPPTGSLRVTTTTTGTNLDLDGYTFSVDGGAVQQIASNATLSVENLLAGSHTVALAGVAEGCVLDGSHSRPVNLTSGATAEVVFAIRCAPGTSSQWTRMETGTTFTLHSVWGSSSGDVFSVGEPGGRFESGIFHYDGQAWSQQTTESGATLYAVWGSGSNDVFAVGSSPLGQRGFDGVLLHYDGSTWTPMPGPGVGTQDGAVEVSFFSVWGSSGIDVFAVGEASTNSNRALIAHYDGTHWSEMPLAIATEDRVLRDISGSSSQDVYAVGSFDASADLRRRLSLSAPGARFLSEGLILHYDGTGWREVQPVAANVAYSGVWASGPNDVFVVGTIDDRGIILHFDGNAWQEMPAPPTGPLLDVWGTSGSDVYAVGAGTLLHYDGQSWTESLAATQRLSGVWGSSPTDVFAVGSGGMILRGTARLSATARQ
jgi:hypothetical protein